MSEPSAYRIEQAMSVLMALASRMRNADETAGMDSDALLCALDSKEPDCMDVLRRVIRAAVEADDFADAADKRIKDLTDRRERYKRHRDMMRGAAFAAMDALGLSKLKDAEFTASIRMGQPRPDVTDEAALPDEYWRISRSPDLSAIRDAMKEGVVVPGVEMTNGTPSISVRTR